MSPLTHLVGSWLIASTTTSNPRNRKLITWAGVLPDLDGLGVVPDVIGSWVSGKECTFHYYQEYHHILMHGWPAAIVVSVLLTFFARQRWRVLLLCLLTFHLHLLCDLMGSHGPTVGGSLANLLFRAVVSPSNMVLEGPVAAGWLANQVIFAVLLATSLWLAVKRGYSFVEVVSERADRVFVQVLCKWFHGRRNSIF